MGGDTPMYNMKLGLNTERKERGMLLFKHTQITFFSNSISQHKKN